MRLLKQAAVSQVVGLVLASIGLMALSTPWSGIGVKTIEIKAPVEKSFAYMADVKNWWRCCDPADRVSNEQGEGLGQTWRVTYEFGMPKNMLEQVWALVEVEPGKGLVFKAGNSSMNDGAYYFVFGSTAEGGTRMVWIGEGSSYLPAAITATSWGRQWANDGYLKYTVALVRHKLSLCLRASAEPRGLPLVLRFISSATYSARRHEGGRRGGRACSSVRRGRYG